MSDPLGTFFFFFFLCGVPLIMVLTAVVMAVRSILGGSPRAALVQAAKQRGWHDTTGPGFRFRFTGAVDGIPFTYEAPRPRYHRNRNAGVDVRIPFEAAPGAFVVQRDLPELGLELLGAVGGMMLDLSGRDDLAAALRALEKLDAKGHGRYVAFATPDAHRDAPHTEALGRVLAELDARAPEGVLLYTWNGELVLHAKGAALETSELVDVAVRCHRVLESDPGTAASYR